MRFAVALSFPSPWRQCGIVVGFARATSPGAAIAVRCVILLAGLALCGCSTGDGALTPMETSFAPTAPDISLVAEKIQTLFKKWNLPGSPEVSAVRPAHAASPAKWVVCLKSDASEQTNRYALFLQDSDIVASRIAVLIDQCAQDQYAPLQSFARPKQ